MPGLLTFSSYQERATDTAVYPGQGSFLGVLYAALGCAGEGGEIAECVKKTWRDDGVQDPVEVLNIMENLIYQDRVDSIDIRSAQEEMKKILIIDISPERRMKILNEIGDEFWYLAQLCTELNANLGDVAEMNLAKLQDRKRRDELHGEGDDR